MKLNAHTRLVASDEVIAPSTSFRDENEQDLDARQGVAFKQRQDSAEKVKSAYTPAFKPEGDSADVMYASQEEMESAGEQSELKAKESKITVALSTLAFLINADSTAVLENPFPMAPDFPLEATSTHDSGMNLESARSPLEQLEARSTHGMDIHDLVENKSDNPDLVSAAIARLKANSTALDNLNPYPDKYYPSTDGYLDAEAEEVEADINPSMFGNADQPLGGMGG